MAEDTAPRGLYRDSPRKAIGWALAIAVLLVVFGMAALQVLTPLVFGVFLYYGTRPIYHRFRSLGLGSEGSAIAALLAVGLPAVVISGLVIITAATQAVSLADPSQLQYIEPFVDQEIINDLQSIQSGSLVEFVRSETARELLLTSIGTISSVTNTLLRTVFYIVLSFLFAFLMFGWGSRIRQEFIEVFDDEEQIVEELIRRTDRDMSSVFFGNMVNAAVTGVIGAISFSILNVFAPPVASIPVPILLGLLTGIASFVPIVGSKIVYIPAAAVIASSIFRNSIGVSAEATVGYGFVVLFLAVSGIIIDTLPDMVLRPMISGQGTSKGGMFLAYVTGPMLFGFAGVFLMPMIVVVFINLHRVVVPGFKRQQ